VCYPRFWFSNGFFLKTSFRVSEGFRVFGFFGFLEFLGEKRSQKTHKGEARFSKKNIGFGASTAYVCF
jgi:hypothetical protein